MGTTFGVFALLCVEYAINAAFILASEYHFGFNFTSEPDMTITDPLSMTGFSGGKYSYFGISSVGLLTLAIYLN